MGKRRRTNRPSGLNLRRELSEAVPQISPPAPVTKAERAVRSERKEDSSDNPVRE